MSALRFVHPKARQSLKKTTSWWDFPAFKIGSFKAKNNCYILVSLNIHMKSFYMSDWHLERSIQIRIYLKYARGTADEK